MVLQQLTTTCQILTHQIKVSFDLVCVCVCVMISCPVFNCFNASITNISPTVAAFASRGHLAPDGGLIV